MLILSSDRPVRSVSCPRAGIRTLFPVVLFILPAWFVTTLVPGLSSVR